MQKKLCFESKFKEYDPELAFWMIHSISCNVRLMCVRCLCWSVFNYYSGGIGTSSQKGSFLNCPAKKIINLTLGIIKPAADALLILLGHS